jgi:hydrogenase-4 component F
MGATVLRVVAGAPSADEVEPRFRDALPSVGPPLALLGAVLLLGLWVPAPLRALFTAAATAVGGQ